MRRQLLVIDAADRSWHLRALETERLEQGPLDEYGLCSGESLAQYLLRQDLDSLAIARGPLPFLAGNKATIGFRSPLTGVPHYGFVGGRVAAQVFFLGLDAIWLRGAAFSDAIRLPYLVIAGRAPDIHVAFRSSDALPAGQRAAFYHLVERELGSRQVDGSVLTLGSAARLGYRSANLAADAIYHAGRGGAGAVMARFASALVLRSKPMTTVELFGEATAFSRNPSAALKPYLDRYCARLSGKEGGTITKLATTGAAANGRNTLPSRNARRVGYELAELGSPEVLRATRDGHTGCHWCPVDCRHWHWVDADYAPGRRDIFLDDFEPTYATFAMLDLMPASDSREGRLALLADVNRRLILPVEQMGCDIIDIGVGLAALFEGCDAGIIPDADVPPALLKRQDGNLEAAVRGVSMLESGEAGRFPALRAVADGPQALAERYPAMAEIVFTGGKGTLGNAGHANALWTFLMPFSRFFGHYSGQFYKVEAELPPMGAPDAEIDAVFAHVVSEMLRRELFGVLCNTLSNCAFTFVIYSERGEGKRLGDESLLQRVLQQYGIDCSASELEWFAQAFWAQSMLLKAECGWQPPAADDLPLRIYEVLSLTLDRPVDELRRLMGRLIDEWKRQAGAMLAKYGRRAPW